MVIIVQLPNRFFCHVSLSLSIPHAKKLVSQGRNDPLCQSLASNCMLVCRRIDDLRVAHFLADVGVICGGLNFTVYNGRAV